MAAAQFEFISLAEKAKQALDGISHSLSSSLLLVDDPSATIIRHSYGLAAFYRTFQPLNVLPIDVELHELAATQALQAHRGEDSGNKQAAENGDGWDEWQWDEKSEAAATAPPNSSTSASASSSSPTVSPAVTVLLGGFVTASLVSHISAVIATLRSSQPFASSRLYVYSALSSQSHEAAGLPSYATIESKLPAASSVHQLPLTYSLLLPSVFFLPSTSPLAFTTARGDAETAADVLPSLSSFSSLVKGRPAEDAKRAKHNNRVEGGSSGTPPTPSSTGSSSISCISAALTSLLTHLRVRPDVCSSGRVGHEVGQRVKDAVARHITSLSSTQSRTGARKGKAAGSSPESSHEQQQGWQTASVVLVDRLHDVTAACSHSAHVLDHMYFTERRASGAASAAPSTSTLYSAVNALHHTGDKDCTMLLNALVNEPLPAVLRIASRLLASSSAAEPSKGRRKGDVDVSKLREQVAQMKADVGSMCAHHGLYEMTKAIVRAESDDVDDGGDEQAGSVSDHWRQMQSLERVCLSSLPSPDSTSSESPLATLLDLLQSSSAAARSLPLLPLLSLSSFLFSALGDLPLSDAHERQYRDALLHRVQTDVGRDELVARLVGGAGDAELFVDRTLTLLQQMRYARATFSSPQLSSLLVSDADEPRVEPFVARLLSLCLDPSQSASDLEQHHSTEPSAFDQLRQGAKESIKAAAALRSRGSDSVSSFLSLGSSVVNKMTSSLSSSMAGGSTAASHPSQHSTLLLMVLGDVSWLEVSAMLRVAALHPACNVLIGCTGIADAEEMAWKTFASPSAAATVPAKEAR